MITTPKKVLKLVQKISAEAAERVKEIQTKGQVVDSSKFQGNDAKVNPFYSQEFVEGESVYTDCKTVQQGDDYGHFGELDYFKVSKSIDPDSIRDATEYEINDTTGGFNKIHSYKNGDETHSTEIPARVSVEDTATTQLEVLFKVNAKEAVELTYSFYVRKHGGIQNLLSKFEETVTKVEYTYYSQKESLGNGREKSVREYTKEVDLNDEIRINTRDEIVIAKRDQEAVQKEVDTAKQDTLISVENKLTNIVERNNSKEIRKK